MNEAIIEKLKEWNRTKSISLATEICKELFEGLEA